MDRLTERGLVARRRSTEDRRRVEIRATPAGVAVLGRAPHAPTRRLLEGLGALDERSLRRLAAGLADLVQAMGLADEPARMLFDDGAGVARKRATRAGTRAKPRP